MVNMVLISTLFLKEAVKKKMLNTNNSTNLNGVL